MGELYLDVTPIRLCVYVLHSLIKTTGVIALNQMLFFNHSGWMKPFGLSPSGA